MRFFYCYCYRYSFLVSFDVWIWLSALVFPLAIHSLDPFLFHFHEIFIMILSLCLCSDSKQKIGGKNLKFWKRGSINILMGGVRVSGHDNRAVGGALDSTFFRARKIERTNQRARFGTICHLWGCEAIFSSGTFFLSFSQLFLWASIFP